jgi:citrate lyase subunit beta/citryl-CoA lyase
VSPSWSDLADQLGGRPVVPASGSCSGGRCRERSDRRSRRAYFGAEDYIADLGGIRTAGSDEVAFARAYVAIAAR